MDEVSKWTDTTPEHRGEAYRQFKEEKTEQILQLLRRFGFHWNHCIEKIHTTTPLSYRDYTGTIDGSAYGIVKKLPVSANQFCFHTHQTEESVPHGAESECTRRLGRDADSHAHLFGICRSGIFSKKVGNA